MEFGERKRRRKSQSFKLVTDEGRLLNECKTLRDACLGVCLALCASRDDCVNKSDSHDNVPRVEPTANSHDSCKKPSLTSLYTDGTMNE